jgi:hypothetical protein
MSFVTISSCILTSSVFHAEVGTILLVSASSKPAQISLGRELNLCMCPAGVEVSRISVKVGVMI